MKVPRWAVGLVIIWIAFISAASGWGYQRQERIIDDQNQEALDRRQAACEDGDASRATIRQMSKDSALEVGEALIEVAGRDPSDPPDPEVIQAFRDAMDRRLTAIVNQLPQRQWDARTEECVDRAVPEQGE